MKEQDLLKLEGVAKWLEGDIDYYDMPDATRDALYEFYTESGTDGSFFVRLQSWNETTRKHETLESLRGKQVRITIETLD